MQLPVLFLMMQAAASLKIMQAATLFNFINNILYITLFQDLLIQKTKNLVSLKYKIYYFSKKNKIILVTINLYSSIFKNYNYPYFILY